jgi:hypothetical protein
LSCCVEQLIRQDALAVVLLPVVAAPVEGEPGTTQAAWQVAAVALQLIMQAVVVEVCASRSCWPFAAAGSLPIAPESGKRTQTTNIARIPASP